MVKSIRPTTKRIPLLAKEGLAIKVLYGVQGEGRGHAFRSVQIIHWLQKKATKSKW